MDVSSVPAWSISSSKSLFYGIKSGVTNSEPWPSDSPFAYWPGNDEFFAGCKGICSVGIDVEDVTLGRTADISISTTFSNWWLITVG
jgi:hypothetical protein